MRATLAVSYTHLDVYKRQAAATILSPCCETIRSFLALRQNFLCCDCGCADTPTGVARYCDGCSVLFVTKHRFAGVRRFAVPSVAARATDSESDYNRVHHKQESHGSATDGPAAREGRTLGGGSSSSRRLQTASWRPS